MRRLPKGSRWSFWATVDVFYHLLALVGDSGSCGARQLRFQTGPIARKSRPSKTPFDQLQKPRESPYIEPLGDNPNAVRMAGRPDSRIPGTRIRVASCQQKTLKNQRQTPIKNWHRPCNIRGGQT